MSYTSSSSVSVRYVIPASNFANNSLSLYHLEVTSVGENAQKLYAASGIQVAIAPVAAVKGVVAVLNPTTGAVITPAIAAIAGNAGTPGWVVFNGISLPVIGAYILGVFYKSVSDVSSANMVKVGEGFVSKHPSLTEIPV